TLVHDIAWSRCVVRRRAICDRAAYDGAADDAGCNTGTNRTAITTGVRRGRRAHSAGCQSGSGCQRENRPLHRVSLQRQVGRADNEWLSETKSSLCQIETVPICRKFVERRPAPRPEKPGDVTKSGLFYFSSCFTLRDVAGLLTADSYGS